jgi:hypothetical protein
VSRKAVAPKKKSTLEVEFSPLALDDSVTRTLTILYNATALLDVALEGTTVAATLTAPKTETFPTTVPGKMSKTLKVTITNPTAATVMLNSAHTFVTANFRDRNWQRRHAVEGPKSVYCFGRIHTRPIHFRRIGAERQPWLRLHLWQPCN